MHHALPFLTIAMLATTAVGQAVLVRHECRDPHATTVRKAAIIAAFALALIASGLYGWALLHGVR